MDNRIAQYQSLSRCEATQVHHAVARTVLDAYRTGVNLAIENCRNMEAFLDAHYMALLNMGFEVSFKEAMDMIDFKVEEDDG